MKNKINDLGFKLTMALQEKDGYSKHINSLKTRINELKKRLVIGVVEGHACNRDGCYGTMRIEKVVEGRNEPNSKKPAWITTYTICKDCKVPGFYKEKLTIKQD